MKNTKIYLIIFSVMVALVLTGCGGGAAAGLIGVAIDGAKDDKTTTPVNTGVNLTLQGQVDVPAGAPSLSVNRNFADKTDSIGLYVSSDMKTYSKYQEQMVSNGNYSFTGTFRNLYVKIRHMKTNNEMFIGRVSDNATGTILVPIKFDTMSVILTKILEKQGGHEFIICGDNAISTMKTDAETSVKNRINGNLGTALTAINGNDNLISSANLAYNAQETSMKNLLIPVSNEFQWDLGEVTVGEKKYNKQLLFMYRSLNRFTFSLYNSETDAVYLNGSYSIGTDSIEFTISSLTNFPTEAAEFLSMNEVGEKFILSNISIYNNDRLTAMLAEKMYILNKELNTAQ